MAVTGWESLGANRHRRDPFDPAQCLCGEAWPEPPRDDLWQEHVYGPPRPRDPSA